MMKHTLATLSLAALSAAASAQGYGVLSVGMSKHSVDCGGTTSCDKSGTAYKILGGYKFTPLIAGEIGYFDFGKSTLKVGSDSLDVKVSGFGAGVALHGNLSPSWTAVGRLGLAQMKTKLTASVAGVGSGSDSDDNANLYGGLGIGYRVSNNVTIDGAWDFSRGEYKKNGLDESGNVNAFSLGLTFSF
jgi:OmpA-OmpF porin, OOP family